MKEKDSKWGWKIAGLVSAGVLTATALYQLYHASPPADFNDIAYDWDTMGTELSEYVSRGQSDDSLLEEIDRALSGQGAMKRKKGMESLLKHRNLA